LAEDLEPRWLAALLLRVPEVFLEYQEEGGRFIKRKSDE
jgi:hypothetical protein